MGFNPVIHFLMRGAAEGRQPHPDIDLAVYQAAHPDCPRQRVAAYCYLLTHENPATFFRPDLRSALAQRHAGLLEGGLFKPRTYVALNKDLDIGERAAFEHFIRRGLSEGRPFTNAETVATLIARMTVEIDRSLLESRASGGAGAVRQGCAPSRRLVPGQIHPDRRLP